MSQEKESTAHRLMDPFDSPEWDNLSNLVQEADSAFEKASEDAWNKLNSDTKLLLFCAISRRIYEGELKNRGTYRHVLYDIFGFGPEAYAPAQVSGYLAIHNAIYDGKSMEEFSKKVKEFAEQHGIEKEKIQELLGSASDFNF
jgi:hypothetical protein